MTGVLVEITPKYDAATYEDFVRKMHEVGIFEKFQISQITLPVHYFRQEFLEHIAEHGFSSFFKFDIAMEDITSAHMSIDDIENAFVKFIEKLQGAKKLIIIDPYFFAKSANNDVGALFSKLLRPISGNLEEICFVTNGRKNEAKSDILSAVDSTIRVVEVNTDEFHDRYWIDPDNNKGIVIGTSLNGLGKKIALINTLSEADAAEIVKLVKDTGSPI